MTAIPHINSLSGTTPAELLVALAIALPIAAACVWLGRSDWGRR